MSDDFDQWYEWPSWAKDALVIDTDVRLSLRDRLRILWHGKLTVTAKTFTRIVVGEHTTLSRCRVPPVIPSRPVGMVCSATPRSGEPGAP